MLLSRGESDNLPAVNGRDPHRMRRDVFLCHGEEGCAPIRHRVGRVAPVRFGSTGDLGEKNSLVRLCRSKGDFHALVAAQQLFSGQDGGKFFMQVGKCQLVYRLRLVVAAIVTVPFMGSGRVSHDDRLETEIVRHARRG